MQGEHFKRKYDNETNKQDLMQQIKYNQMMS